MRPLVLAVTRQPLVQTVLTTGPGRALARRFVAGETLDDAIDGTRRLIAAGRQASLDFLGESVSTFDEAQRAAAIYHRTVSALLDAGLTASLSIKPTQFGIDLDFAGCARLVADLAVAAETLPATVRLDMEDSSHTDQTLRLWRELREKHPNVGVVLQAALRRTESDMEKLIAEGATIRLCKGAYAEPPRIAFPRKSDVDANFDRLMKRLLEAAAELPPAQAGNEPRACIATHDERLVRRARKRAERLEIGGDRYEFQMLFGVRRDLQSRLVAAGEPLRVYVPWGPAWYPYLTRRLAERPANLVFFARALLSEVVPGNKGR